MDEISGFLQSVISKQEATALVMSVFLNFGLGIAAAFKRGDFQLAKAADFINGRLASVLVAYLVASVAAVVVTDYVVVRTAAWVVLEGYLVAKIGKNLVDLGLPVPSAVANLLNR